MISHLLLFPLQELQLGADPTQQPLYLSAEVLNSSHLTSNKPGNPGS
jgi:hypothetical protein